VTHDFCLLLFSFHQSVVFLLQGPQIDLIHFSLAFFFFLPQSIKTSKHGFKRLDFPGYSVQVRRLHIRSNRQGDRQATKCHTSHAVCN